MNDREMAQYLQDRGWGVIPPQEFRIDMKKEFFSLWEKVNRYTMTSIERGYALYKGVEYVVRNSIPGDFVECGVWKGGSCMLIALILLKLGVNDRKIVLFDTFTGMTEPSEEDRIAWNNSSVIKRWKQDKKGSTGTFTGWAVSLEEVKEACNQTGYPENHFKFVKGDVLSTLKGNAPGKISFLRLDTDWYESTREELEVLYPRLIRGGVLIIDDYGHFTGARKAVDEYFREKSCIPLLNRVDYTGRIGIKI